MSPQEAQRILDTAELIVSAGEVDAAVDRLAGQIDEKLRATHPLVLTVMGGAVVFAGHLLTRLRFPLEFDYVHVTRYGDATRGGTLRWIVTPREQVEGRTVLVVDDILDEGITLAAIVDKLMNEGARACYTAVFADKDIGRPKPIRADFVGVTLPNRYVFGYGMDVRGAWRNLPEVWAVKD